MKGPIQSVEVAYLVHATEDPEKVRAAVESLLGEGVEPEQERLEGHFGNEITRVRVHLTGDAAQRAFERVVARMPLPLKREVIGGLASFVDEHSALFLRFDKQLLVGGGVALGSRDPVRMKVKPRVFLVKGGAPQFYARLLGGD